MNYATTTNRLKAFYPGWSRWVGTGGNIDSLTPCLCGYYTTSFINFLHFLRFIASSLCICQIWLSSSRPTTSENLVLKGVIELIWTDNWPPAARRAASTCVDRSQRRTEPCVACRGESAGHRSASAPPINSQSQSLLITTANDSVFSLQSSTAPLTRSPANSLDNDKTAYFRTP